MSAFPVTLTHPDTGATYMASTRLELMEALGNGWTLTAQEREAMVAKTSGKRKAKMASSPELTDETV
jgi:hypothetical protein